MLGRGASMCFCTDLEAEDDGARMEKLEMIPSSKHEEAVQPALEVHHCGSQAPGLKHNGIGAWEHCEQWAPEEDSLRVPAPRSPLWMPCLPMPAGCGRTSRGAGCSCSCEFPKKATGE